MISAGSVSYALIFLGLYLAAHAIARVTVPWADPYLLPLTGLLTAIGLTEIYRLGPSDAFRQGFWIVVGVGVFAPRCSCCASTSASLESYKYLFGVSAVGLLVLPALPVIGATHQRGPPLGEDRPAPVPAGRAGEDRTDRLPRRLPAREARGARPGTAEGLRAAARDLGRRDARPGRDQRPRQRAPLLRDLPRDALRRHRSGRLRRRSASGSSSAARRPRTSRSDACRSASTAGCIPGTTCTEPATRPSRAPIDRQRRLRWHRSRPRHVHDHGRDRPDPAT